MPLNSNLDDFAAQIVLPGFEPLFVRNVTLTGYKLDQLLARGCQIAVTEHDSAVPANSTFQEIGSFHPDRPGYNVLTRVMKRKHPNEA